MGANGEIGCWVVFSLAYLAESQLVDKKARIRAYFDVGALAVGDRGSRIATIKIILK